MSKISFTYLNEPKTNSFIYGLIDPRDNTLRYIGQTYRGKKRFDTLMNVETKNNTYKGHWLLNLKRNNTAPLIMIIEEAKEEQLSELEIFYIAYFKFLGCRLTNYTDGGEGTRVKYSQEKKIKQRQRCRLNKPLIDLNSFEVYPSIMECSRQLSLSNGALSDHLNRKPHKNRVHDYQFAWLPKDVTDIEGWCDEQKFLLRARIKKYKRVICLNTGEIFSSIKAAGERFDKTASWVYGIITGKSKSPDNINFEYYYERR